jgi:hypothetical protein
MVKDQQLPVVCLPCDLPLWPIVKNLLMKLQARELDVDGLIQLMEDIQHLCNFSVDGCDLGQHLYGRNKLTSLRIFHKILANEFPPVEREKFMQFTVPCIARYAACLKELKPTKSFLFSLHGVKYDTNLDRRFVASLMGNMFFSTFPRRSDCLLPFLPSMSFDTLFGDFSLNKALRLRDFLNYFDILDVEEPWGHVRLERIIMPMRLNRQQQQQAASSQDQKPLTPIFVSRDLACKLSLNSKSQSVLLSRFCTRDLDNLPENVLHPELFILFLFAEELAGNEQFSIRGLLHCQTKLLMRDADEDLTIENTFDRITLPIFSISAISYNMTIRQRIESIANGLMRCQQISQEGASKQMLSSTISSKSSLLNEAAAECSCYSSSSEMLVQPKPKLKTSDINHIINIKQRKKTFTDRLKDALARGNTPDSENIGSSSLIIKSSSRQIKASNSITFYSTEDSESKSSIGSVDQVDLDAVDADVEDMMIRLLQTDQLEQKHSDILCRNESLKDHLGTTLRKSLSDSFVPFVLRADDLGKGRKTWPLSGRPRWPSMTLHINPGHNCAEKQLQIPSSLPESDEKCSVKHSVEVIQKSDGDILPILDFALIWIATSLAEIPLLILPSTIRNMDEIFILCNFIGQQKISLQKFIQTVEEEGVGEECRLKNVLASLSTKVPINK